MSTTDRMHAGGIRTVTRTLCRRTAYAGAGLGVTILLFSAGLFLGGGIAESPVIRTVKAVPVSDTIVPEPEEEIFELPEEMELPQVDVDMDILQDVVPPSIEMDFAVNTNLDVSIAVPAPPVMESPVQAVAPPAGDMGNKIYGAFQLETPPRLLHASPPAYPRQAKRNNLQGVVRVKVVLDKSGGIVSTDLVPGPHTGVFGAATLEAVRKWRFTPGKIGNRPVMCEVEIPVEFNLDSGSGSGARRRR